MSLTGPGCEHCDFTGSATWPCLKPPFDRKPCDRCGGISQLANARDAEFATLRARVAELTGILSEVWDAANGHAVERPPTTNAGKAIARLAAKLESLRHVVDRYRTAVRTDSDADYRRARLELHDAVLSLFPEES